MSEPGYRPLLSVLMPTMVKRENLFLPLARKLCDQAEKADAPVEIVGLQNQGEKSIAEYREMLLRDARGSYLCFVDDDDDVTDDYMWALTTTISAYNPDVVTFVQACEGLPAQVTLFGLQYLGAPWPPVMINGVPAYLRVYSHMQPILTEVARQGTFMDPRGKGFTQEDQHFANSVVPLLIDRGKNQAHVSKTLYVYRWMHSGESTQEGRQTGPVTAHPPPEISSPCFRWYGQ